MIICNEFHEFIINSSEHECLILFNMYYVTLKLLGNCVFLVITSVS